MTAAQRERAALVETMRAVGPDAPTLCGDWTTRDLAAHLIATVNSLSSCEMRFSALILAPAGARRSAVTCNVFSTTLFARPGSSVETTPTFLMR